MHIMITFILRPTQTTLLLPLLPPCYLGVCGVWWCDGVVMYGGMSISIESNPKKTNKKFDVFIIVMLFMCVSSSFMWVS